jgi:hypothetical protein
MLCDADITGRATWIANYMHTQTLRFTANCRIASQMLLHLSAVERKRRYFMFFRRSGGLWAARRSETSRHFCWNAMYG